jgi:hypothetical protein
MSREQALNRVNTFLSGTPNTSLHFLCLQRDKVGAGLLKRVADPGKIRQGPAGLCGPASLLFDLATRDPDCYASFGISLFEQGNGKINKLEVKPNRALKIAMSPPSMDQADWLMMASIRNSENTPLCDYDAPSGDWNQFKGMTLPGEMKSWLKKVGYTQVVDETSVTKILSMDVDNARDASTKYEDHWSVFLFINANMLNFHTEDDSGTLPDHWVELRSKIEIQPNSVKFKVFTWGEGNFEVPTSPTVQPPDGVKPQPRHDFTQKMFLSNYYCYIAARF